MAAPSKSWTVIPDSKIDADSPVVEELKTFERDNGVHDDERIGIPVAPGNRQANHRHRGLDNDGSDFIELTPQENLISRGDGVSTTYWATGAIVAAGNIAFASGGFGSLYEIKRSTGVSAYKNSAQRSFVSSSIVQKIKSASGKGRFTCSMHMKRVAAASGVVGGILAFGLFDGSAFIPDARVFIDFDDVTQEYKRFWFVSNQITRPTALWLAAAWVTEPSDWDTISNGDLVGHHSGYMVNNSAGLAKWDISHRDGSGDDYDANTLFYWWDEVITLQQETVP